MAGSNRLYLEPVLRETVGGIDSAISAMHTGIDEAIEAMKNALNATLGSLATTVDTVKSTLVTTNGKVDTTNTRLNTLNATMQSAVLMSFKPGSTVKSLTKSGSTLSSVGAAHTFFPGLYYTVSTYSGSFMLTINLKSSTTNRSHKIVIKDLNTGIEMEMDSVTLTTTATNYNVTVPAVAGHTYQVGVMKNSSASACDVTGGNTITISYDLAAAASSTYIIS